MRRVLKWVGIVLGSVVALVVVAVVVLNIVSARLLTRTLDIQAEAITIPADDISLARGEYLVNAICTGCHGDGLSGELMFSDAGVATVYAPNITPSEAGVGAFSDADYVRALRHAVNPDGQPYMIMPAEVFINWSEEDLGSAIAYLKALAPDETPTPARTVGILSRTLLPLGVFGEIFPADFIEHDMPFPVRPEIGATAEYGAYFATAGLCTLCHGDDMMGGSDPNVGEVPPTVQAAGWSTEAFITAVTTGVTPYDGQLDPERMPWETCAKFNREELEAIHLFIQTLPAQ